MPPAHGRFNVGIVSLLLSLFSADEEMNLLSAMFNIPFAICVVVDLLTIPCVVKTLSGDVRMRSDERGVAHFAASFFSIWSLCSGVYRPSKEVGVPAIQPPDGL